MPIHVSNYVLCSGASNSVTPWTAARQAPLSMGFLRQEYWSGLPFPSPRDLPNPGIEPVVPALAGRFFTICTTREAMSSHTTILILLLFMRNFKMVPHVNAENLQKPMQKHHPLVENENCNLHRGHIFVISTMSPVHVTRRQDDKWAK